MFHMSTLWPKFTEASIQTFLEGIGDQPVPEGGISTELALSYKQTIEHFLGSLDSHAKAEYPCLPAYEAFERERLMLLNLVLNVEDPVKTQHYCDELYGRLSDLRFDEVLSNLKQRIENLTPRSAGVAEEQARLLGVWQNIPSSGDISKVLTSFDYYRTQVIPLVERRFGFVHELMQPYLHEPAISSKDVESILEAAIDRILGKTTGWGVLVLDGAPNVFIDHDRRAIIVPAGRQYTKDHVENLVVHEIGVHIARSVNGENSRERLAAVGMCGYGPTEEAFGVLLGSATQVDYEPLSALISFVVIHFAASSPERTFREIHRLTKALLICLGNPDDTTFTKRNYEYGRRAFGRVIRTLRLGTPQIVERSTTKYWRGILLLNEYLDTHGLDTDTFDEFFAGKYDCFDQTQLNLIKTHAIN